MNVPCFNYKYILIFILIILTNLPKTISLAETKHTVANKASATAIGISRQNAMAARLMFHRESQLLLLGSISIWNNEQMDLYVQFYIQFCFSVRKIKHSTAFIKVLEFRTKIVKIFLTRLPECFRISVYWFSVSYPIFILNLFEKWTVHYAMPTYELTSTNQS